MSENTKKNTTAEATKKNSEAFVKALNSAKAEYTKREAKEMFNIYANIVSVTSKSARVFLKNEVYEAFKAYAEAKSEEAKKNAENKDEDSKEAKTAKRAEAFNAIVQNADKDRAGIHKYAITVSAEHFKQTAEAFKAYAKTKSEAKKQTADETQSEAQNAAK